MKILKLSVLIKFTLFLISFNAKALSLTLGNDVLYAVEASSGSTQNFGIIDPTNGLLSYINQIQPQGLGWPLGDIGSQSDPIKGEIYSMQYNSSASQNDVLAIKKK